MLLRLSESLLILYRVLRATFLSTRYGNAERTLVLKKGLKSLLQN